MKPPDIRRILIFGNPQGLPISLSVIERRLVCGLVGAAIRPEEHDALAALAESNGLPLLFQPPRKSRDYAAFVENVGALETDFILVNSYSMRLQPDILAIPAYSAINVHGGLLPQYRGSNPIQWCLINDERETGVTAHYMTQDFDSGDMVGQLTFPIDAGDTWRDIAGRQDVATAELLADLMAKVLDGTVERHPQNPNLARHHRRRRPEDGLIDWNRSVWSIYNLIRALVRPHPGAFYVEEDKKVVLDTFHTVAEVATLKFARGALAMTGAGISLVPISSNDEGDTAGNDAIPLIVRDTGSGQPVGACRIFDIDFAARTARLDIRFDDQKHAHQEPRSEALRMLSEFARRELGLRRIVHSTNGTNHGAIDEETVDLEANPDGG